MYKDRIECAHTLARTGGVTNMCKYWSENVANEKQA
jgi:hypothetical protein